MARIVRFYETGGPEVLKIEEAEPAAPGAGEIRLRVHALGLNRAEVMFRMGQYLEQPKFPARIGYEAAGVVEAVGDGVSDLKPGDKVSVLPGFSLNQYGVYGEWAVVPAVMAVKHPETLSWEEAASVWMQYMTAYGALIDVAKLRKGEAVIITAASSSVGLAAIQIVNQIGAISIATTRTGAKRDALLHHGAQHVIATGEQTLAEEVKRITGGKGARLAFDPVGGEGVNALAEAAAQGGMIMIYGLLSGQLTPFPIMQAVGNWLSMRGYTLGEVVADAARRERGVRFVLDGLASGALKPVIAKAFPFEEIVAAHRYMESNEQIGKIVVTVP